MPETKSVLDLLKSLHQQFEALEESKRNAVQEQVGRGVDYFSEGCPEDIPPNIQDAVAAAVQSLSELADESEQWSTLYEDETVRNSPLMQSILNQINPETLYRSSRYLRKIDPPAFSFVVSGIIKDVLIDRKYQSIEKIIEKLRIEDPKAAAATHKVITFLVDIFYEDDWDYDSFQDILREEIGLVREADEEKVKIFLEIMQTNREGLEKRFLFSAMQDIRERMTEIEERLDEIKEQKQL